MSHPPSPGTSSETPAKALSAKRQLADWGRSGVKHLRTGQALSLVDVAATTVFAWSLSQILITVETAQAGHQSPDSPLMFPLLSLVLSLAAKAIFGYTIQHLNHAASRQIIHTVRMDISRKWLKGQGLSAIHAVKLTSLIDDTEALEGYYARFLPARQLAALVPLIIIGVVAWKSPFSALILLGTLCPFVALMALSGLTTATQSKAQLDALSRLSHLFSDRLRALPLILSFEDGPAQVKQVERAASEVSERTLSVLKIAFTASAILEFFAALSVALIAVYCGFTLLGLLPFSVPDILRLNGASAFGAAFFALALSPEVYAPMRRLSAAYHDQQTAVAATERLMALTHLVSDAPIPAIIVTTAPPLTFDQVTARFDDDADFYIGPISFTAAASSVTALTGPTGSGKSSLLCLLLNASQPHDGHILIDDQPLRGHTIASSIAWMSQHTPILAGTLRDNLRLSQSDLSDADMQGILDLTGVSQIIAARAGGLNHLLNERGSGLSGGERRRIGLARALLKPAPILILDEPTADLDPQAEADLIAAIKTGFAGRTVIMATHSEKLMALADQVVSL